MSTCCVSLNLGSVHGTYGRTNSSVLSFDFYTCGHGTYTSMFIVYTHAYVIKEKIERRYVFYKPDMCNCKLCRSLASGGRVSVVLLSLISGYLFYEGNLELLILLPSLLESWVSSLNFIARCATTLASHYLPEPHFPYF